MDYWRIFIYGIIAIAFLALGEALWRRQWGLVVDRVLNIAIFFGFLLMRYPPPALHGVKPFMNVMVPVLLGVSAIRGGIQWHREIKARRELPVA